MCEKRALTLAPNQTVSAGSQDARGRGDSVKRLTRASPGTPIKCEIKLIHPPPTTLHPSAAVRSEIMILPLTNLPAPAAAPSCSQAARRQRYLGCFATHYRHQRTHSGAVENQYPDMKKQIVFIVFRLVHRTVVFADTLALVSRSPPPSMLLPLPSPHVSRILGDVLKDVWAHLY